MYQALYRKYRPQTFSEVVGQKSVTDTLRSQLESGKLSHAYLFTGTRGTGKTTCAKILSRAVNCENPQNGDPCGVCPACRAIADGSCMDVQEIDAASNNGIDNVRILRDEAIYTPGSVKMRVYIIDEVHMLTMSAFNALLKIIEEPPAHLLFILATTEIHKVPATILSRCQRFAFKRLTPEDVESRLNYIAYQEHIDIDPAALRLLSRLADGALRDGVSLLDQCASAASGAVTEESVCACLGLAGEKKTAELLMAIARKNTAQALQLFASIYAAGKDVSALFGELCTLCRDLLVLKTAPQSGLAMLSGIASEPQAVQLEKAFSSGELMQILSATQAAKAAFSKSSDIRVSAELLLMQLCEPSLQLDLGSMNARISRMEEQLASGSISVKAASSEDDVPYVFSEEDDRPPFPDDQDDPMAGAVPAEDEKKKEDEVPGFWPELSEKLRAELRPMERGFFAPAGPIRPILQGDTLLMAAQDDFVLSMVKKPAIEQLVRQKASAIFQKPVAVRFVLASQVQNQGNDPLDQLVRFGEEHGELFHIK